MRPAAGRRLRRLSSVLRVWMHVGERTGAEDVASLVPELARRSVTNGSARPESGTLVSETEAEEEEVAEAS